MVVNGEIKRSHVNICRCLFASLNDVGEFIVMRLGAGGILRDNMKIIMRNA